MVSKLSKFHTFEPSRHVGLWKRETNNLLCAERRIIMTAQQLSYLQAQETARHNREMEDVERKRGKLLEAQTQESEAKTAEAKAQTDLIGSKNVQTGVNTTSTILDWLGKAISTLFFNSPAKTVDKVTGGKLESADFINWLG